MEMLVLTVALVTALHLLYTLIEFHFGFKKIANLSQQAAIGAKELPLVSIILSALNEEEKISDALLSMLSLDYPKLEIIAINDRSTDRTGTILDQLALQFPDLLKVIHISTLPDNWLGKNHALHIGANTANGEWLLFTDADVIMKKSLLQKAMSYALKQNLDHLTIHERHLHKPFWLQVLSLTSYTAISMAFKPWRIAYAWSKKYLGYGAFNLVRKETYDRAGGHSKIALKCLDDLSLGKLLKTTGGKQATVNGKDFIEREWYTSLSEMVKGLSKNSFAFFDFKLSKVTGNFIFALLYYLWPIVALCICSGLNFWLNVVNVLLTFYLFYFIATQYRVPRSYALFYPLGMITLLYTVWYSVILTYKNNGIIWRDTHYSLEKLRTQKL